ncbi:uncharacterized protein LOC121854376 [Homarus americanus]|uniref:Interleukin-1 receptor-associated kinase 1-binding protein 1-like n=1 Tax=Homarus americanus TaxID=6706 RepID=A0A8J5MLU6_HOMAM|nr:uncharacterized protein LOC121854376 [Homarus americanus]KAG7155990.1 Interleukin-1 receptor-associated kinase 1-binding protein 1-like [Homarus americanus]
MGEVVEVVGVGEVEVRPQLASLTLIISAHKNTIEECRASVEKRRPYVIQTLFNNKAEKEEVTETDEVRVGEAGGLVLVVMVTATLPADAARRVANTLVEKLGNNVTLEKLVYRHSWVSLSEARVRAGRRAAEEARQRAADMAVAVGGTLGPCLTVKEDSCTHVAITEDRTNSWMVDTALGRQEVHAHTPTIIQSTVKATFSLVSYGVPKTKKA